MDYELTQHARKVIAERAIRVEWMELTLGEPEYVLPDPVDPDIERFFRAIPENDGRVLRVAVNTKVEPARVVSVFFDRNRRSKS